MSKRNETIIEPENIPKNYKRTITKTPYNLLEKIAIGSGVLTLASEIYSITNNETTYPNLLTTIGYTLILSGVISKIVRGYKKIEIESGNKKN